MFIPALIMKVGSIAKAAYGAMTTAKGLGIASLAMQGAGVVMQYQAGRAQADVASKTAEYNAKLQENQAIQADMEGREEARRERARSARILATGRAEVAASGVTMAGSPLEVLGETAGMIELERLDAARARRQAYAARKAGANMTRWEGNAAASGYRRAATGSLLSSAANLAGSAYNLKQSGAFSGG